MWLLNFCRYLLLLSTVYASINVEYSPWEYVGPHSPEHWPELYPSCNGQRQSPIDVDVYDLQLEAIGDIVFNNYSVENEEVFGTVINNGHTAQVKFENYQGYLSGNILKGKYGLSQIHFHWGKSPSLGSEHTVGKERFSLEMHAVHANFNTSVGDYVVLSYLFAEDENKIPLDEDVITKVLDKAAVIEPKEQVSMPFNLSSKYIDTLFNIDQSQLGFHNWKCESVVAMKDYCVYQGSLTTPPCSEIVTWIMTRKLRKISRKLMEELRTLRNKQKHNHLYNNFRFLQPLHGRQLVCNQDHPIGKSQWLISFTLDTFPEEVEITMKRLKSSAINVIAKSLKNVELSVTYDSNLSGQLKRNLSNGKLLSNLQLIEGLVYFKDTENGIEIVILRNDDRKEFFQSGKIYGVGKIIAGNSTLNSVIDSARIGNVQVRPSKSSMDINF